MSLGQSVKLITFVYSGAFKFRGAFNAILSLSEAERQQVLLFAPVLYNSEPLLDVACTDRNTPPD